MKLRKAIFDDWKILFDWRNDPVTRKNSFNEKEINELTHKLWFNDSLLNPHRNIYILEDDSIPVGTIRSDIILNNKYILSWNINPKQRGKGYGTEILKIYLQDKKGEFIAEIKPENTASIKIAQKNGFIKETGIKYIKNQ